MQKAKISSFASRISSFGFRRSDFFRSSLRVTQAIEALQLRGLDGHCELIAELHGRIEHWIPTVWREICGSLQGPGRVCGPENEQAIAIGAKPEVRRAAVGIEHRHGQGERSAAFAARDCQCGV